MPDLLPPGTHVRIVRGQNPDLLPHYLGQKAVLTHTQEPGRYLAIIGRGFERNIVVLYPDEVEPI